MSHEVVIDGVQYVPVIEASPDARKLLHALTATWWGSGDMEYIYNKYGKDLRVVVTDDHEGDGEKLEDFVAQLLSHIKDTP